MQEVLSMKKENLKGKIVVDITNPVNNDDWSALYLGEDSGGEQTARLLPQSKVVKAFNTIFSDVMYPDKQLFHEQKLTAFIASDDRDAAATIKELADDAGFYGLVVGEMKNARHLEAIAHLNIAIALAGGNTDAGFRYFQRATELLHK
jgi:predicted dinucleotide-binding enzyme